MSQNVNLLFTKNCLIPCNLEIGRKSQKGSDETVLHVLPWACLFPSPSLHCHCLTAMKVKWASTPYSPEPLSMQPIQPPTQPPMSEEILFVWSWPSGLCFRKAAWNFLHPQLDCYKTILADPITVYLPVCVCVHTHTFSYPDRMVLPWGIGSMPHRL